jgi:hypothetical protein
MVRISENENGAGPHWYGNETEICQRQSQTACGNIRQETALQFHRQFPLIRIGVFATLTLVNIAAATNYHQDKTFCSLTHAPTKQKNLAQRCRAEIR